MVVRGVTRMCHVFSNTCLHAFWITAELLRN